MAEIMTVIRYQADLNKGVTRQTIRPAFLQGNAGAHKLEIFCVRGSEVVALIDEGVTAYFVRDDGRTVLIQGTVENGEACVVLPAACYAVEGSFELVVQVSGSGDNTSSIYWGGGMVRRSHTEELVDPGKVIPSLDELLAKIGLLEQTTARAEAVANLTAQAQTLPAGSEATASYANGKLTLGIPKGKDSETALPTGYKPFDMLVVGPDGAPRWEERTHYDYSGTVLPLSDLKVLGGHHTFDKPLDIMPVVGVPYRVSYQGTEYTVTGKAYVDEGKDCVTLGNQWYLGPGGEKTPEPFILLFYPPESVTNNYYGFLSCTDTSASTIALGIESAGELKKIDPKFLPEGSGGGLPTGGEPYKQLVTDGDGNAVWADRLAYEGETVTVEILPETELVPTDEGFFNTTPHNTTPKVGDSYTFVYNGVEYECVAQEITMGTESATVIGNIGALTGAGGTTEPFLYMVLPDENAAEMGAYGVLMPLDGATSVTISILAISQNIHTIPQKYLPEYIYGEYKREGKTILEETTGEVDSGIGGMVITKPLGLVVGNTYIVNCNGAEYELVAWENEETINLGRLRYGEGDDPIGVQEVKTPMQMPDGSLLYGLAFLHDGTTSITISIAIDDYVEIKKVPRKYLDIQDAFIVRIEDYAVMQCTYDDILQAFEYGRPIFCLWRKNLAVSYSFAALSSYSGNTDQFVFFAKDGTDNLKITISKTSGCTVEKNTEAPYALYLTSPNGTRYQITVSDDGVLSATKT